MQSTGHTSTHAVSFVPIHGSQMMYATAVFMILAMLAGPKGPKEPTAPRSVCDPALAALFTPPRPAMGRYEVCTTGDRLESVVAAGKPPGGAYRGNQAP